jgi:Fe-S-cluster containining protein
MEVTIENCQTCGVCCYLSDVVASEEEVRKISEAKQLDPKEFSWPGIPIGGHYKLKFKANGDCFFLEREEEKVYCDVYIFRPRVCKEFPKTQRQKDQCPNVK